MTKKSFISVPETSQQGAWRLMQQDIVGHRESTDDKIEKLQATLEKLIVGMDVVMETKILGWKEEFDEEDEYLDDFYNESPQKGVFRDPVHAAKIRQMEDVKPILKTGIKSRNSEFRSSENRHDSLKHLKLSFPLYKEGSEALEWIRDCEEYFSIYEVTDRKRSAIAAMHLSGVPRSWYKSYMLSHPEGSTWQQFAQAFLSRFGELDTELVFDKFKRLQQEGSVESYFDDFEKLRGQLLSKIPSLTNEYFLENFIGGLQLEIKSMIRLLEPSNLEQALKLARFYEQSLPATGKRGNSAISSYKSTTSSQF